MSVRRNVQQSLGPPPAAEGPSKGSDNRSDEDANRERVFLLERDERLEIAERKQRSFFNRMFGEALVKSCLKETCFQCSSLQWGSTI